MAAASLADLVRIAERLEFDCPLAGDREGSSEPGVEDLPTIVDDDPRLLESMEDLLESAGYAACGFFVRQVNAACSSAVGRAGPDRHRHRDVRPG